ncbi:hypothetical protein [Mucilaginibacter ginsenosidivorax]|uniref:hypothetical protein n=1 Tax=Mucilaginibacter ginsenosidivorax TaxID=862126 RepID=UPI0013152BEC|nr:hypothetical protein [Mucilaginibacter ginsenosidivorax]
MKQQKTWLILGAAEGLGPSAVKYLSAHGQHLIEMANADFPFGRIKKTQRQIYDQ